MAERTVPKRPLDVTIFGVLFLISAPIELYNIMSTDWTYSPKFFGILLTGSPAKACLIAQPLLHVALGYGFLTLRRWALYLALFYAADTLTSAISSLILIGYGRIRAIFIAVLAPFAIYLIFRRRRFVR
ncbi:MAG: hypothetical protein HY760_05825 [Nitrospirae bacterium]|nr:hypothetical protein [Nitrospirota bacterium]